ncbi:pyridoxamine 5'-phosphate oxidase family protein [Bacillus solimangrovi]|uniref:Pyridoxamine 5-phosphate oxidase n=1 Tax=Bacillus solimangrovi TaxID=1305675 RepID=A0A1E5LHV9_9BACI|nr:pyridoxamine 5'-phosphate oxidase family protein [Bacillus solimangrovi]OEH93657.1 pyridoxamine 5-phosphate oxidase [Bacillus solimangrovi]
MRRDQNQCTDMERVNEFCQRMKTGYLGLVDGQMPYVVPFNFVWLNNCIYFHGAEEGRKQRILEENPNACFTIAEDQGTITDPIPAHTSTGYFSVMIFGNLEIVDDVEESTNAMQVMLDKYVPGYFSEPLSQHHVSSYRSSRNSKTVFYRLHADHLTAKENKLLDDKRFYPGRTREQDIKAK